MGRQSGDQTTLTSGGRPAGARESPGRSYTRHRFARPTTVAWTLLEDGDAESIRSEVAAGHHDTACGLFLNRAIELLSLAAALPETTLPA